SSKLRSDEISLSSEGAVSALPSAGDFACSCAITDTSPRAHLMGKAAPRSSTPGMNPVRASPWDCLFPVESTPEWHPKPHFPRSPIVNVFLGLEKAQSPDMVYGI